MKFDTKIEKYDIICGKQNKQGAIEDMNKIFIICSKAFYKDIPPIKEKLEENGWEVFYLIHTKILMLKKNGMLKEKKNMPK